MATVKKTKVPAIIDIPADLDPKIKRVLESLKEASEVRLGRRGDPRDRAITLRELIDSGLATELRDKPFDPNAGTGITDFALPSFLQPDPSAPVPPAATGLSAGAAFTTITLDWNDPQISNLAFTEVWRNGSDNLGSATRVDTVSANVWSDTVDTAQTFYYWVRHVNTNNVAGTFSSSVNATTAQVNAARIENAIIDNTKLVNKTLTNTKIADGTITSDILAANSVIAGKIATNAIVANDGVIGTAAIATAQIVDAAINNAKIAELAVDAAKIANATITNAKIGDGEITNAKIASLNADKITAQTLNVGGKAISGSMGTVSFNQTTQLTSPGNLTFDLTNFFLGSNPLTTTGGTTQTNLVNFAVTFPTHSGGANKNYIAVCTFKPVGSFPVGSEIISTFSVSSSSAHATSPSTFHQFVSTEALAGSQKIHTLLLSIPSGATRYFRVHGNYRNVNLTSLGQRGFGTISIHVNGLSA
ncbi:MAG: hypothetical protein CMI74_07305 [Candidatus Pelagibacter sp.]|nr:hypothetical protein [Candidatus Pelagibacter sp.]|tara:strand:- start:61 stop:1485 length:1425 start_codon:yes stop_codon:yes gene_type:complete